MTTTSNSDARSRGLGHALRIQQAHAEPEAWKAALDAIADPEERRVAREYLKGIWIRTKAAEQARAGGTRAAIIPARCPPEADPGT
jgi:hypothetical protein